MKGYQGKRVLVVEDNQISYKLMEAYLQRTGIDLLHARDGKEAIEMFGTGEHLDLVLMDIQLPNINGIDVSKTISKIRSEVPIVATTANAFDDDRKACLDAGCVDYISKPIRLPILLEIIEKYLT